MSSLKPAFKVAAFTMAIWSVFMFLSMIPFLDESATATRALFVSGLVCISVSMVFMLLARGRIERVRSKHMFLVTTVNWGVLSITGALPLYFGWAEVGYIDALFESVSGVTTTGSTILAGLDNGPRALLLWRSIMQWVGGLGIILMAVAVLPFLRIGGMRLFQTESSEWSYHQNNRVGLVSAQIGLAYVALTLLAILVYWMLGMTLFEAVNHAFTSLSTGGYSTSDASFGQFNTELPLVWAGTFFMFLGGVPFLLYVNSYKAKKPILLTDGQVRLYLVLLLVSIASITLVRMLHGAEQPWHIVLTHAAFNVVSVVTTTGFATEDYTLWGSFSFLLFGILMFTGACSGSTSGGVKLFRFQLLALSMRESLFKSLHPNGNYPRRYNGRPVSEGVLSASLAFVFMVLASLVFFTLALSLTELDSATAFSAALTALMNVGPGFGDVIGPSGNFSTLSSTAKLILCVAMLLGRLEYLALIILLSRRFWTW